MDYRRFLFSVLSCLLVLSMVFSNGLTAHATEISEELSISEEPIMMMSAVQQDDIKVTYAYGDTLNIDETLPSKIWYLPSNYTAKEVYLIATVELPEPIERDQPFDFTFTFNIDPFDGCGKLLDYSYMRMFDATMNQVGSGSDATVKTLDGKYSITARYKDKVATTAVKYIRLWFRVQCPFSSGWVNGDYIVLDLQNFTLTPVSTSGLLNSIIEWIKSIYNGIINLPANIANAIGGFFDMVVDAVTQLGETIIQGIKNLFVPTEEDLTEYRDKWDSLLSNRFGALYEVGTIIIDFGEAILNSSRTAKGTVDFPQVSVNLAGANFTFGGWSVNVIPNGFGFLVTAVKTITSIAMVFAFVNGLKKRYDRVMTG